MCQPSGEWKEAIPEWKSSVLILPKADQEQHRAQGGRERRSRAHFEDATFIVYYLCIIQLGTRHGENDGYRNCAQKLQV